MRALVLHRCGGPHVVRVEEVAPPPLEDDRVLVRVQAGSLNKIDWFRLRGSPRALRPLLGGVLRPKSALLGVDFAGVAEAVGKDVADLQPGDEVFGARDGARVLGPHGRLVLVGAHGSRAPLWHIAALGLASLRRRRELVLFTTKTNQPDLQFLADLLESGQLTPAIDRTYELAEAEDALRSFGEGHVCGKLVLTI